MITFIVGWTCFTIGFFAGAVWCGLMRRNRELDAAAGSIGPTNTELSSANTT